MPPTSPTPATTAPQESPGSSHPAAAWRRQRRADSFLYGVSLFALVYCVVAFGLRAATNVETAARLTLPVVLHAALMTAWLVVFALQIHLKRAGRLEWHRRLGPLFAAIAVGIVVDGLAVSWTSAFEFAMPEQFSLNGFVFLAFGLLVALAIRAAQAGDFARHKRFLLVATLTFLGPATARALALVGGPPMLAPVVLLLLIALVPWTYDRLQRGKWHAASIQAALVVVGAVVLAAVLAATPLLAFFAEAAR